MATIDVFPDKDALVRAAADLFVSLAREVIGARGRFSVALSGGGTPKPVYELLATKPYADDIDWGRVHVGWGDERCVPPDDERSNFRMAKLALLDKVPIPPANIHRIKGELPPAEAADGYERELRALLGDDTPFGAFDLVLLGLGDNGHTASLFPGTYSLREQARWAVPQYVEVVTMWRVTLTAPLHQRRRKRRVPRRGRWQGRRAAPRDRRAIRPRRAARPARHAFWGSEMDGGCRGGQGTRRETRRQGDKEKGIVLSDSTAKAERLLVSRLLVSRLLVSRLASLHCSPKLMTNLKLELAPSILAADFARLGEQVRAALEAGARIVHVDVMDGRFVPNLSMGPQVVKALRPLASEFGARVETHLMIVEPERYLADFAKAGSDVLIVHVETCPHLNRTVQQIRELGARNPSWPSTRRRRSCCWRRFCPMWTRCW